MLLLQFQLVCLQLGNPDFFTGRATLSQTCCFLLSLSLLHQLSRTEYYDPAGHLWTFQHLEEQSGLKWPCTLIISTRHSQKRTGHPSEPGSSLSFFLGSCLSREFFLATVLLHLHCLMFAVLGWVSNISFLYIYIFLIFCTSTIPVSNCYTVISSPPWPIYCLNSLILPHLHFFSYFFLLYYWLYVLFIPCVTLCCCMCWIAMLYLGQVAVANENLFSTSLPG